MTSAECRDSWRILHKPYHLFLPLSFNPASALGQLYQRFKLNRQLWQSAVFHSFAKPSCWLSEDSLSATFSG
ncbi:hypothetical protein GmHk_13G036468 [Glycine max]|nr:hypothetical protein GmHk_13G036468 [Glycine max]